MNEEEELGFAVVPEELRQQKEAIDQGAAHGYFYLTGQEGALVDSDDEDIPDLVASDEEDGPYADIPPVVPQEGPEPFSRQRPRRRRGRLE